MSCLAESENNRKKTMTVTISRLYNSYPAAQDAVNALKAAGVKHGDISITASNAIGLCS
jgi:hypothetical protein